MTDKVSVNGKLIGSQFDKLSDNTLLDYLEKQKVDVHYHCREGYCGACRCKLVKGKTDYKIEPIAFIRPGEILLCCATPDGDVELELD
jgi:ferredoxin